MSIKYIITFFVLLSSVKSFSQDYQLRLNDTSINISVGKNYDVNINGKPVKLFLSSKDTLEFKHPEFSFMYPKDYMPSKHAIDSTAEQVTILTAEGSGILVQYYFTLNPETLSELMLQEITKESISYGYKMKREEYDRHLQSGQTLKVIKATLTYKDEIETYEVTSVGKKDSGLMIVSMNLSEAAEQGKKIINLFWNSLKY